MLLWLLACSAEPVDCQVTLSEDPGGVATVQWTSAQQGEGSVAYGLDGALDVQTGPVSASQHRHLLLGLPPSASIGWQASLDGEPVCAGSFDTPALPSWVAPVQVTVEDRQPGALLASVWVPGTYDSQVLLFDRQGVVRWYHRAEADRFVVDVQPALDGSGVLFDQFHNQFSEDVSAIISMAWDGGASTETAIPLGHHMFAQLPGGALAYQAMDVRDWTDPETGETEPLVGDAIVELSAGGELIERFTVWDWLEVEPNAFSGLVSIYPQGIDWTHGNALKYDEGADAFLLSLGNAGVVMSIDRQSGEPTGSWGSVGVPVAEGSPPLEHQHDPTWIAEDRLLVFDSHFADLRSGAHEYQLVDGELVHVWQHESPDELFALILGQAERLDDGGTRVNFGSAGVIEEIDASGAVRWRVELGKDLGFGQARWLEDFPTP